MTGLNSKGKTKDVISSMFFSAAIAMIFSQVAGVSATIIDGIITSRFLGADALSAISLMGPFVSTVVLVAGFVSTGSQVLCSSLIGEGKRDEAKAIFSLSIIISILGAVLIILLCGLFPDGILRICGVSPDRNQQFYKGMIDYLHGYMYGIPAVMLVQIIGPFIAMDNGKGFFSFSAVLLCVADIIGDIANAVVIKGGIFGMGFATSISLWVQLLFLLTYYLRKNCYFSFTLSGIKAGQLVEISRAGSPTLVRKLATVLRDLFVSRINLSVAITGAAVAARAVQNDLNTLMFCIGLGIGKALISITGIYYSANDKNGLKRLFSYSMKMAIVFSSIVGAILFVFAPLVADFYSSESEVKVLAVFAIRCMAISMIMDTLLVSFQNYLQGIRNRILVNIFNFGERLFVPVIVAFVMGNFFGSKGVLASIAIGKIILIFIVFIMVCIHKKGLPTSMEDYMFLPNDFGGDLEDNLYGKVENMDEVVEESRRAEEFCLAHGCDKVKANHMACFVEEIAGNIIRHGKHRGGGQASAEYRIFVNNEDICITVRDYCYYFSPTEYYQIHHCDDSQDCIGIRLVTNMAKQISYFNAFNSNNLIIHL